MNPPKRTLLAAVMALAGVAVATTASAGGLTAAAPAKPVIGPPTAVPAKPQAGKPFAVSFRVTSSSTHKALTSGLMASTTAAAGKSMVHKQSFRGGVARVSLVVPATAGGKALRVAVTIRSGGQSATKTAVFAVQAAPKPTVSAGDASVPEGNTGTTTLSFPVTLSHSSQQVVSVSYATANGTAAAPTDYTQASGTVSFSPGETSKSIAVSVVADTAIEQDETLTVTLSNPANATIAGGTATGTITNDDTQVPITVGDWQGAMQTGDYVYFTVRSDRRLSFFRVNNIRENCDGGVYISGSISWSQNTTWPIADDGSLTAANTWTGSEVDGDFELTAESWKVASTFNGSSASGTFILSDEFNYKGQHYSCSTGTLTWTAKKI